MICQPTHRRPSMLISIKCSRNMAMLETLLNSKMLRKYRILVVENQIVVVGWKIFYIVDWGLFLWKIIVSLFFKCLPAFLRDFKMTKNWKNGNRSTFKNDRKCKIKNYRILKSQLVWFHVANNFFKWLKAWRSWSYLRWHRTFC